MADVFVSYSRHDGDFVHELHDVLVSAGRDVWVDWEDIPPASNWQEDIDDSIDAAESVVFVVSASSLSSEYCAEELAHAQKGGKRVVPIAIDGADPAAASPALRELNWIWARAADDRAAAFEALERALDTDLDWSRAHTRLLVRAVEWDKRKDGSLLLRGRDLAEAERELAANAGKEPRPTELQQLYLHASRRAAGRRQRALLGGVTAALVVSVALGVVAVLQRNTANDRARAAESKTLAVQSVDALETSPRTALARAVEAYKTSVTPEARMALRRALLANPIEWAVPGSRRGPRSQGANLEWSPDGRTLLALAPNGQLRRRRAAGGPQGRDAGHADAAALGPAGRLLTANRRRVRLEGGAATVTRRLAPGERVLALGFAGATGRAVVGGHGRVGVLDVATGSRVPLGAKRLVPEETELSPDGTRVATLAYQAPTRVWDARTGRLLAMLPTASSAAISPDGRYLETAGDNGDVLWALPGGRRVARLGNSVARAVFSPKSDLVALIEPDGGATLWRTRTGRPASTLPGYGAAGPGGFSFDPGAAFSWSSAW